MRLFIAIDFQEISGYLKHLQEKIPEAKATFPKKFHLTLKFLGEVDENMAKEAEEKLKQVKAEPFRARLGKTGVFPNENFIRVVWIGLEGSGKIYGLQEKIEEALGGMFKKDDRFSPHITLARIKFIENDRKKDFAEAVKQISVEPREIEVRNFKLVKSTLTKQGPVYEDIAVFPVSSVEQIP